MNGQGSIELTEDISLKKNDNQICWNLLSICKPELLPDNRVKLQQESGEKLFISCNESRLEYSTEELKLNDERLNSTWGDVLYRINFKLNLNEDSQVIKFFFDIGEGEILRKKKDFSS